MELGPEVVELTTWLADQPRVIDALRSLDTANQAYATATVTPDPPHLAALIPYFAGDARKFRRYVAYLAELRKGRSDVTDWKELLDFKHALYGRNLMAERRARLNRALALYKKQGYDVTGVARRSKLAKAQFAHWKEQRDAYLERERMARGGTLDWEVRLDLIDTFWAAIDADLDKNTDE